MVESEDILKIHMQFVEEAAELQDRMQRHEGTLAEIRSQLKEKFNCTTKTGQAKLKKLVDRAAKLEFELNELIEEYDNSYTDEG